MPLARGLAPGANTLGHYDDWTNRISLFDVTAGSSSREWSRNAETIIHEATHQTAFNTGVHARLPLRRGPGSVKGLRPCSRHAVFGTGARRTSDDRINRQQLAAFKDYEARRWKPGALGRLVAGVRQPF